jgi:hypothetical protein
LPEKRELLAAFATSGPFSPDDSLQTAGSWSVPTGITTQEMTIIFRSLHTENWSLITDH